MLRLIPSPVGWESGLTHKMEGQGLNALGLPPHIALTVTDETTHQSEPVNVLDYQYSDISVNSKDACAETSISSKHLTVPKHQYRRPKSAAISSHSKPIQKPSSKTQYVGLNGQKTVFHRRKVKGPRFNKNPNTVNEFYNEPHLKPQQNYVNVKQSLDVPKIYVSSQDSSIGCDRQRNRSNSPPPRRYSEVSFLKTLLDALPMDRNDSVDSGDELLTEGADGGDDLFAEEVPAPIRGGRKISTASLGCLRENLKSSRSYGKTKGNERMQRSRSASQMMTTAASVEKLLFKNRLM
ncbi:hypothetical protein ElyMa_003625800 [Elysia marginata]|uniref:Uncharacterized protein n=1 Tax=Elysia marginata TaxID=1093978 RepID=A0AAV4EUI9_9GAST|nr:hypothetical protein ElyMa_003625800 [Elysia marginata]